MSESIKQQLQEAEKKLEIFTEAWKKAKDELTKWTEIDAHREDGSERQDRLHDEWMDDVRNAARTARNDLETQQVLVDKLKEQLRQGAP